MNSLAHEQARTLIQQGHLIEPDRSALRQHLVTCDECRLYAAMHVQLQRQQPVLNARARPAPVQRDAILAAVGEKRSTPLFWRPLMAAGGLASVVFLVTAFWLVVSAIRPMAARPASPLPGESTVAPLTPLPAAILPVAPSPVASEPDGGLMTITVPAPSLAGNLIGEPLEQEVVVYLPPSYGQSDRRYPVVYGLLTTTSVSSWRATNETAGQLGSIAQTAMKLALGAGGREMIVVIPDPVNSLGLGNHFVDSPVTGQWEGYLTSDLISYIDTNYRTLSSAGSRGIFGEYQHGLSALLLAARHPDVFSAVSMLHPLLFYPGYSVNEAFMQSKVGRSMMIDLVADASAFAPGTESDKLRNRFPADEYIPFVLSEALAYGMAYAPAVEAGPPYVNYPYRELDGQPDSVALALWENGLGNLEEKLAMYADELRELAITIDFYEKVPGLNSAGPSFLSEQLTAYGVAHTARANRLFQPSTLAILGQEVFPTFSHTLKFD